MNTFARCWQCARCGAYASGAAPPRTRKNSRTPHRRHACGNGVRDGGTGGAECRYRVHAYRGDTADIARRVLAPGAHVNAVGSSVPPFRELDTTAVTRARVYVDMRECVLRESDDLREPIREGALHESDIVGELSEMVSGTCALRTTDDEITLFKSVGMALEDIAALRFVYERALAARINHYVEF